MHKLNMVTAAGVLCAAALSYAPSQARNLIHLFA
jgi:hypothetical protein